MFPRVALLVPPQAFAIAHDPVDHGGVAPPVDPKDIKPQQDHSRLNGSIPYC